MYLLIIPSVALEVCRAAKLILGSRSKKSNPSESKLGIQLYIHSSVRLFSYGFLLGWTVYCESNTDSETSLIPGFVPITVFAIYSIGADFLWSKFDKVGSGYVLVYKIVRAVVLGQCLYLSSKIRFDQDKKLDIDDLQSQLWTIQIGGLLLIPVLLVIIIYYSVFVISNFVKNRASFDKRHIVVFSWIVLTSFSIFIVFFLTVKFKSKLFELSTDTLTQLSICIAIVVINSFSTFFSRRQLE